MDGTPPLLPQESEASLAKQLNEAETRQLQAEGQARTAEERLTEESAALSVAEEMKRRAEEAAWNSIAEARRREGDVAAKASALAARLRASRGRSGEEGEVTLSNVDPAGAAGEGLEAAAAAAEALLEETEKERRAWLASSKV